MQEVITKYEQQYRKKSLPHITSGDTVRVHQKVLEGGKERIQVFEGTVLRTRKLNSLQAAITVRRVATAGVGVEKIFSLHAPSITKVDVVRRGKVRRNYLTYIRKRAGRAAKLRERAEREAERQARLQHEQSEKDDAETASKVEERSDETLSDEAEGSKDEDKRETKPDKAEDVAQATSKDKKVEERSDETLSDEAEGSQSDETQGEDEGTQKAESGQPDTKKDRAKQADTDKKAEEQSDEVLSGSEGTQKPGPKAESKSSKTKTKKEKAEEFRKSQEDNKK